MSVSDLRSKILGSALSLSLVMVPSSLASFVCYWTTVHAGTLVVAGSGVVVGEMTNFWPLAM